MISRVIVVGPGRLGASLALDLAETGRTEVTVIGRSPEPPAILAAEDAIDYRHGGASEARRILETSRPGDRSAIVFSVPDDHLADVVSEWLDPSEPPPAGNVAILHASGALPAAVLRPLADRLGASAGSWHPLAPIAEPRRGAFRDVTVGIEGDEAAVAFGEEIASWVGAGTLRIPGEAKARYHAAAVFASNYLVACLHAAAAELGAVTGATPSVDALIPLARSAIENVADLGTSRGASGPLSRGDVETIRAHLEALDPPHDALYRALGGELLRAVGPRLDADAAREIERLLGEG
jgi:predicted short-subunit dehydrogenase-like oxidoreductase (DUF2520 family)